MVTAALRRRSEHPALHVDVLDPVGDYHLEALTLLWHRHWSRLPVQSQPLHPRSNSSVLWVSHHLLLTSNEQLTWEL